MAEITVAHVPRDQIEAALFAPMADGTMVADALDTMQERSHGEIMAGWFLEAAEAGNEQLWLIIEGKSILGLAGTVIEVTGTGERRARIRFCTGEDSERWWLSLVNEINDWGRHHGCTRLRTFSRPGWSRRLRSAGFQVLHIEHDREIKG